MRIKSFVELHNVISSKFRDGRWIYRGQANSAWPLIPKKGREDYLGSDEKEMFERWRMFSRFYLQGDELSEWDLLAIAQHHGVPTRLLDWSDNPLVACFFALSEEEYVGYDGALYAYRVSDSDLKYDRKELSFRTMVLHFSNQKVSYCELYDSVVCLRCTIPLTRL